MTLVIGMSKPEGIYLSVDYQITDFDTREFIHDKAIKSLTIHYPPLDHGGPKVLLGFSGLAELCDGTPMLTWIRETLRGESEVIDQSMAHLRARLNRDIAPLQRPLIINLLVLERYRRLFGGFTNQRITAPGHAVVMPRFQYVMTQLTDWTIFANGSGAVSLVKGGHFARLQPYLGVVPRDPVNHMHMLASMNRKVAADDDSVSRFCQVSFIPSSDRFPPSSRAFIKRGESVPFEVPILLAGLDLTDHMRDLMQNFEAFSKGQITEIPEPNKEQMNERQRRRP